MSQALKRRKLNPLVITWGRVHQKKVMREVMEGQRLLPPEEAEAVSARALKKSTKDLYKRWNVYPWGPFVHFLQLPVWLSVMESLRRMVGMNGGLLSILQSWVESTGGGSSVPLEQSMSAEGAFWFPDLLAADPIYVLPVLLSATVFTNITWGWKVYDIGQISNRKLKIQAFAKLVLKRSLQVLAISLAPCMIEAQAPAGLLIYWISSSFFATIQTRLLNNMMEPVPVPTPCIRKGVGSLKVNSMK
jgi:inner membrane protein COX18